MNLLTVCTGNVARSVMLRVFLEQPREPHGTSWNIQSAGTHASEGDRVSARTLTAIRAMPDLAEWSALRHSSQALSADVVQWADVIVVAEVDHLRFIQRQFPEASAKVALMRTVARTGVLRGGEYDVADGDVPDPAGGDQDAYHRCASELWDLARRLRP
jgi:protein-tyrosine phosphatase